MRIIHCIGALAVLVLTLTSCSMSGVLYLYSALDETVTIHIDRDTEWASRYTLESRRVNKIFVNLSLENDVLIRAADEELCYLVPQIPVAWVKPGFTRAHVKSTLAGDRRIYLYAADSDKETFYEIPAPKQPVGFPLTPYDC